LFRTLLELGPFKIQSYGLMLAVAFLLGGVLLIRGARKRGLDEGTVLNLIYIIVFSSVIGSRLMYVLGHLDDYRGDPISVLKVWEGGLTLYGGLLLAVVLSVAYMKSKQLPIWTVCDLAAPAIALGKAVTRVGCFMNGCCFGARTESPWGVVFPYESHAGTAFPGAHLHPAQLYSSGLSLLVFGILLILGRKKLPAGTVFWCFLLMDSIARVILGFFRYSEAGNRAFAAGSMSISVNQVIAAALALISIAFLARLRSPRAL
jgi:phosphatidylglycerol:prolipoprotein diacylglycerol transferase